MTVVDTATPVTWPDHASVVVDGDVHVLEPRDLWLTHIDPQYRERAPQVREVEGIEALVCDGQMMLPGGLAGLGGAHLDRTTLLTGQLRYEDGCPPASYDPVARQEHCRDWGLTAGLTFPTIGILPFDSQDDDFLNACSRAYNRWMTAFAADAGGTVLPVAHLNLRDIPGAIAELDRCLADGFKAVFLPPETVGGKLLSDPALDPLWARCAEADVPVCPHVVVRFGGPARPFGAWGDAGAGMLFGFSLGAPGQLIPALTDLIVNGALERNPDLKVLCVEAGAGWAPYLMDRLAEKHHSLGRLLPTPLSLRADEYVQRQCWFVAEPAERTIGRTLEVVGEDRILWGSDYPHIDATMDSPHQIKEAVADLAPERQAAVLGGNAATLFGL